jgi:transcriptional antiterminator RfaH
MQQAIDAPHAMYHWYVVHCKPHKEWQAASALTERLGLATYLLELRRCSRGRVQRAPLFPRYLFVRMDLQTVGVSHINATAGVLRLVSFGGAPPSIPETVIEALRQRVDILNDHGGLLEHGFHPGDTVRLTHGPLRGLEAIFIGPMKPSERVRVLIEFLGQPREMKLPVDILERAGTSPAPKRERRTRGKGRWITR